MISQLIETWQIHNRINLYLLASVDEVFLNDHSASKGRDVAHQFAHLHNVRLMWLKEAAPQLMATLSKIENEQLITKEFLHHALSESSLAIEQLIEIGLVAGKIKGFKPHPVAFVGYLISHESHHRGQIVLSLKQSGHSPDRKTLFGLWEWGVR
ncbi:MAG: DinB family protein [Spirosomataceae bacterium]